MTWQNNINPAENKLAGICDPDLKTDVLGSLPMNSKVFVELVNGYIRTGLRDGSQIDFVTDQVFALIEANPTTAKEIGFPDDRNTLKQKIIQPYYDAKQEQQKLNNQKVVTKSKEESYPTFRLVPGYSTGGIYIDENNQHVMANDANGYAKGLNDAIAKAGAVSYASAASLFVGGPALQVTGKIAAPLGQRLLNWSLFNPEKAFTIGTGVFEGFLEGFANEKTELPSEDFSQFVSAEIGEFLGEKTKRFFND